MKLAEDISEYQKQKDLAPFPNEGLAPFILLLKIATSTNDAGEAEREGGGLERNSAVSEVAISANLDPRVKPRMTEVGTVRLDPLLGHVAIFKCQRHRVVLG